MAYPYTQHKWIANHAYNLGEVVRANPASLNTLAFKCIVPGKSDEAATYADFPNQEPAFPRSITHTLVDGGVTWEAFEPLAEELQKLAPSSVIDLFQIVLTEKVNNKDAIYYFHSGTNEVTEALTFDGIQYAKLPASADGFEFTGKGVLPRPTIKFGNVNNAITFIIQEYNPLGAQVKRIRTFAKFIDAVNFKNKENPTADPSAKTVETWYIDRIASENQQYVEFELTPKLDMTNLALPKRTIEEFCPWVYRGNRECPYVGDACFTVNDVLLENGTLAERKAADVCGKRLSSCQARFPNREALPYGGFYGARLQA